MHEAKLRNKFTSLQTDIQHELIHISRGTPSIPFILCYMSGNIKSSISLLWQKQDRLIRSLETENNEIISFCNHIISPGSWPIGRECTYFIKQLDNQWTHMVPIVTVVNIIMILMLLFKKGQMLIPQNYYPITNWIGNCFIL